MKYLIIVLLSIFAGVILCHQCRETIPDDSVVVKKSRFDSLQMIAESTPEYIYDTITKTDTLKIPELIYQDRLVHVEIGKDTLRVDDTLSSKYFDVFLMHKLTGNRIFERAWSYNVFIPEKIITETITQKIPFPYEVEPYRPRLYGGLNVGNVVSGDISYRIGNSFYGIGMGYMGDKYFYVRYQFAIK